MYQLNIEEEVASSKVSRFQSFKVSGFQGSGVSGIRKTDDRAMPVLGLETLKA
jgi:hypothetical protein